MFLQNSVEKLKNCSKILSNANSIETTNFSFNRGLVTVARQVVEFAVGDRAINVMLLSLKLKSIQRALLCKTFSLRQCGHSLYGWCFLTEVWNVMDNCSQMIFVGFSDTMLRPSASILYRKVCWF